MLGTQRLRRGLAAASLLLLPGCFLSRNTLNEALPSERVEALAPGQSSEEVVRALGAPAEVVQLGRRSAWRYEHVVEKRTGLWLLVVGLMNTDTRSDRVWVFFDEQGLLTHAGATLRAEAAQFQLPWSEPDYEVTR